MTPRARKILPASALVGMTLFPLAPLLRPGAVFYDDWRNHLWQLNYQAAAFSHTGHAAPVLNTAQLIGIPFPVFYGVGLFPLLGALTPSGWALAAMPIAIGVLAILQAVCVFRGGRDGGRGTGEALALAALVSWASYPLTNLYSRSAIPEWIATTLLTIAISRWYSALQATDPRAAERRLLAVVLAAALFGAVHPITALYGGTLLLLLVALSIFLWPARRPPLGCGALARLALVATGGLVALGPWLYATYRLGSDLFISRYNDAMTYLPVKHAWLALFAPVPYDWQCLRIDPTKLDTPYLTTQLNVALLALAGFEIALVRGAIARNRRAGAALGILVGGWLAIVALSVHPSWHRHLPAPYRMIQFGYRLITYQNALILIAILLVGYARAGASASRRAWTAACLALAVVSVGIKLSHAAAISQGPVSRPPDEAVLQIPYSFHAARDYLTMRDSDRIALVSEASRKLAFPVDATPAYWSEPRPLEVAFTEPTWVITNVLPFAWNELLLDGRPISREGRRRFSYHLVASVPAGKHRLEYRFAPDARWSALRAASPFGVWAALAIAGWIIGRSVYGRWRDPYALATAAPSAPASMVVTNPS